MPGALKGSMWRERAATSPARMSPPEAGGFSFLVLSRSFLMPELCRMEPGVNTQQKVISSPLHDVLVRKLHPDEFPRLSGVMAAVVVFVLDTTFIEPPIVEIKVERGVLFLRARDELAPKRLIRNLPNCYTTGGVRSPRQGRFLDCRNNDIKID